MEYKPLAPNGPVLMIPQVFGDSRGYFLETFRQSDFEAHCGMYSFVQDNQSKSTRGVLRGLHYQLTNPQGKLVRVVQGRVFDVAVDLRRSSPYFGKSYGVILDAEKHHAFWVPPGFAHGFLVLSPESVFIYKCTAYYAPDDEHSLIWNDPDVAVQWPLDSIEPLLSAKDENGLPFGQCAVYD